jgi:hypothetical protein
MLCDLKFGPFGIGVFCRNYPWLDEEVWHESFEVHGHSEGVRCEAGRAVRLVNGQKPVEFGQKEALAP